MKLKSYPCLRSHFAFATATLLLVSVSLSAHDKAFKDWVQTYTDKLSKAVKNKDFASFEKTMKSMITPDFRYVEMGQSQTFEQMTKNMKAGLGSMEKITKCTAKVTSIKQTGKTATIVTTHEIEGKMKAQDGKSHTLYFLTESVDSMVKIGKDWKLKKAVWTTKKELMDGKPFGGGG